MFKYILAFLLFSLSGLCLVRAQDLPITTYSISPDSIVGNNGWYQTSVEITLTATASVGIASINYRLDAEPWSMASTSALTRVYSYQGNHNLAFYSVDNLEQTETPLKNFVFKIDSGVPGNWRDFAANQNGNDHTYAVSIKVDDAVSGLDNNTAYFQYSVDGDANYGYYAELDDCNGQFIVDGWYQVTAVNNTISTPSIDFCNSNWSVDKVIKFKISDLAGNIGIHSETLNGAYIEVHGGEVYAGHGVNLKAQSSTDFSVSSANFQINGLVSQKNWLLPDYDLYNVYNNYNFYYSRFGSSASPLPQGKIPITNGVYLASNGLTLDKNTIGSVENTENLSAVIFINGDLEIKNNFNLHPSSFIIFIVKSDVNLQGGVTVFNGGFLADGKTEIQNDKNGLALNGFLVSGENVKLGKYHDKNIEASEIISLPSTIYANSYFAQLFGNSVYTWAEISP